MKTLFASALWVSSVLAASTLNAAAPAAEPTSCLPLVRIDHTSVVDDQNILFYTHGGRIYLNRLANPAPGLGVDGPFMYKTSIDQLCANQIITVLESVGFGYLPGSTSALGKFEPIDEADANSLLSGKSPEVQAEPAQTK